MHSSLKIITVATIATLAVVNRDLAQDASVPPAPAVEAASAVPEVADVDAQPRAQEQLERARAQLERQVEKAEQAIESLDGSEAPRLRQQLEMARAQVDRQLQEAGRAMELAQAGVAPPPPADPVGAVRQRLNSLVGRAPAKVLIVRFGQTDPTAQAKLEEDLSVMSRVLERSLVQKLGEDDGPKASGIQVFFSPDGGSTRNLYLEGYGAVFLMNVRFPLLAPANKAGEEKPKHETDSTWEDAKRDLYGEHDPWNIGKALRFDLRGGEPQEYDSEKVEILRKSVLESMKSASNIRGLKLDEWIAVTVLGGASQGPVKVKSIHRASADRPGVRRAEAQGEAVIVDVRDDHPGGPRGTIMTLRVKKSDVDDFAKGRLDLDQFTKKVSITTYAADTGGWGGGGWFGMAP